MNGPEGIMLSEIREKKISYGSHLYLILKKSELLETNRRMVVARGWGVSGGCGKFGQRVQASTYKMNKFWRSNYSMMTIVNNTVLYIWKLLRK